MSEQRWKREPTCDGSGEWMICNILSTVVATAYTLEAADRIVADHNALAGRNPRALGETCRTMRALIDKLRLVIPALNGVTVMAYVHGMKYDGPTINEELEAADTALRAFEREG